MDISQNNYITGFLDYLKFEKRFSPHTLISYQTDLGQFFNFVSEQYGNTDTKAISAAIIRSWLASLKGQKNSSKTINRKISSLKSFFKYLMRQGEILQTPMTTVISPRNGKRLPLFVAEKDVQTLQNHVEFTDDHKGKTEKLILLLLYNTGIRLSELINLTTRQLDKQRGQIKVTGKGNKERIIPVSRVLLQDLEDYINNSPQHYEGHNYVFVTGGGKKLYPKFVYNLVKCNLSLVTTIEKKSPHILRHTFATHLANNGADLNAIKELLGHSSLAATQVYTHNSIDKLKEVFKNAHPRA